MEGNSPEVQWFPGHMQKTRRLIAEHLRLVDVAVELRDARLPDSSANPLLRELLGEKPGVIALNKSDLADPAITKRWLAYYRGQGQPAFAIDSVTGRGLRAMLARTEELARDRTERLVKKGGRARAARIMVVGIPNVGKSSLINRLAGKAKTRVENRPGVTRDKQWIRVDEKMELLDTPGILWPRFDDPEAGRKLAFIGSINDEIYDSEAMAAAFLEWMQTHYPERLQERYKLQPDGPEQTPAELLAAIGAKRGCLLKGGRIDTEKVCRLLMTDLRAGKLGPVSFDEPPGEEQTVEEQTEKD